MHARIRSNAARRGFTLIEVAISIILIGVGILALLVATGSSTAVNRTGSELSHAVFLAQELREYTMARSIDDVDSTRHDPPLDGRGAEVTDAEGWAQVVTAWYMDPDDLSRSGSDNPADPRYIARSDIKYVGVTIERNGRGIYSTGWFVVRR